MEEMLMSLTIKLKELRPSLVSKKFQQPTNWPKRHLGISRRVKSSQCALRDGGWRSSTFAQAKAIWRKEKIEPASVGDSTFCPKKTISQLEMYLDCGIKNALQLRAYLWCDSANAKAPKMPDCRIKTNMDEFCYGWIWWNTMGRLKMLWDHNKVPQWIF